MKFERTRSFRNDYHALAEEHRVVVRKALPLFLAATGHVAANAMDPHAWPGVFRVHMLKGAPGIYSVTFNYRRPDLRATFEWTSTEQGEPVLRWRRIGR